MNFSLRSLALAAVTTAAIALPAAHAQLKLTGSTYGTFADPMQPFTTVTNTTVDSTFASGTAYRPYAPFNDTSTSIVYRGQSFADVGDGEALALGILDFKNGITLLGSTATSATMDLFLDLSPMGVPAFKLTTLTFMLDNTDNLGVNNIPDLFKISYAPLATLWLDEALVTFDLVFSDSAFVTGDGKSIAENSAATTGDLFAHIKITPIPEPSTYALAGISVISLVVLLRRRRNPLAA